MIDYHLFDPIYAPVHSPRAFSPIGPVIALSNLLTPQMGTLPSTAIGTNNFTVLEYYSQSSFTNFQYHAAAGQTTVRAEDQ